MYHFQIYALSNEYFHLVPQSGYIYEKVRPLDTMDELKEKWQHITALLELECASRIVAGAQHKCKGASQILYSHQTHFPTNLQNLCDTQISQTVMSCHHF